jgi:hypothetical protein
MERSAIRVNGAFPDFAALHPGYIGPQHQYVFRASRQNPIFARLAGRPSSN